MLTVQFLERKIFFFIIIEKIKPKRKDLTGSMPSRTINITQINILSIL